MPTLATFTVLRRFPVVSNPATACLQASEATKQSPAPRPNNCNRSRLRIKPGQDLNDCTVLHLALSSADFSCMSAVSSMLCRCTCTCSLFVITTAPGRRLISAFLPCAAPVAPNPLHWKTAPRRFAQECARDGELYEKVDCRKWREVKPLVQHGR